jgi:hypothetical protein
LNVKSLKFFFLYKSLANLCTGFGKINLLYLINVINFDNSGEWAQWLKWR